MEGVLHMETQHAAYVFMVLLVEPVHIVSIVVLFMYTESLLISNRISWDYFIGLIEKKNSLVKASLACNDTLANLSLLWQFLDNFRL